MGKEVREVLDQEGGRNKSALNGFWKIGSIILREVACAWVDFPVHITVVRQQ